MNVPFLSYDQLKAEAARVLLQSSYASRFPVAIELIVERDYKMDIVPIRGLQNAFNIDAFISRDMTSISVDDSVLDNRLNRYRFSLAHELGHRVLHREILGAMEFKTIEEWKSQIVQFPEPEYGYLEYQANTFANCQLVLEESLDRLFREALQRIKDAGMNPANQQDVCLDSMATWLGRQFEVSRDVVLNRLNNKHEDFLKRLR
jgi:hypothetical protein